MRGTVGLHAWIFFVAVVTSLGVGNHVHGQDDPTDGISFRFIETNGVRLHVAEKGEGPLVILCHGFPESWYSWRHQIHALAAAGYHVIAPDQRGYGKSDKPMEIDQYSIFHLVGDIVGIVGTTGKKQAFIAGHDWGAPVAWHCCLLRPDLFKACALISVPYSPRRPASLPPIEAAKAAAKDGEVFYQVYFQTPGLAEAAMERDLRQSFRNMMYTLSGDAPAERRWNPVARPGQANAPPPEFALPDWLTEADLDFYVKQYEKDGFRGGLNWYRNIDRNWLLTGFLNESPLRQPTLFVGGAVDPVILGFGKAAYDNLEASVPHLSKKVLLPKTGHWVQQEEPAEVNRLLIEFLNRQAKQSSD